jgi:hypothetical protein
MNMKQMDLKRSMSSPHHSHQPRMPQAPRRWSAGCRVPHPIWTPLDACLCSQSSLVRRIKWTGTEDYTYAGFRVRGAGAGESDASSSSSSSSPGSGSTNDARFFALHEENEPCPPHIRSFPYAALLGRFRGARGVSSGDTSLLSESPPGEDTRRRLCLFSH